MIIVLKPSATEEQIIKFTNMLKESYDVKVNKWDGVHSTVLGLIEVGCTYDSKRRKKGYYYYQYY